MELAERWFDRETPSTVTQLTAQDILLRWQSLRKMLAKKDLLD
jgi:hypothetical protein